MVVREDVLEDAVAERDVEAQAIGVEREFNVSRRCDRSQLGRTGGTVVDRVAVGVQQCCTQHIQAGLAQRLVQLAGDRVDDQLGHRHVVGRVGVLVPGHRVGQDRTEPTAGVARQRQHVCAALATGHAQQRVAQRVNELRRVLELVADQRQRQAGELRLQARLDTGEHAVQAREQGLGVVQQREDVDAGQQRGHHHIEAGGDAAAQGGIERAVQVQHVVGQAIGIAVACGATQGQAGRREVQRQIELRIAAEIGFERAAQFAEAVAPVAAVVAQARTQGEVQAGTAIEHLQADLTDHRHVDRDLGRQRRVVAHVQAQLQARAVFKEDVGRRDVAEIEPHAEVQVSLRRHLQRAPGLEVQAQVAGDLCQGRIQLGQIQAERYIGGVGQTEIQLEVEGRVLVLQRHRFGRHQAKVLEDRHQPGVDLGLQASQIGHGSGGRLEHIAQTGDEVHATVAKQLGGALVDQRQLGIQLASGVLALGQGGHGQAACRAGQRLDIEAAAGRVRELDFPYR